MSGLYETTKNSFRRVLGMGAEHQHSASARADSKRQDYATRYGLLATQDRITRKYGARKAMAQMQTLGGGSPNDTGSGG